jgi:hypothetical protein
VTGLPVPGDWAAWLNGLATAAAELDRQLESGLLPDLVVPAAPTCLPPEPLSSGLLDRARALTARLQLATSIVQERRDAVAGELSRLCPPRPKLSSYASWDDGAGLDVSG